MQFERGNCVFEAPDDYFVAHGDVSDEGETRCITLSTRGEKARPGLENVIRGYRPEAAPWTLLLIVMPTQYVGPARSYLRSMVHQVRRHVGDFELHDLSDDRAHWTTGVPPCFLCQRSMVWRVGRRTVVAQESRVTRNGWDFSALEQIRETLVLESVPIAAPST